MYRQKERMFSTTVEKCVTQVSARTPGDVGKLVLQAAKTERMSSKEKT